MDGVVRGTRGACVAADEKGQHPGVLLVSASGEP
jgi:hypothetical protein